jgi:dihydroneopterin aldolase
MVLVGPALALLLAAGSKYAVMPVAANEVVTEKSASLLTETLAAELRQQSRADVLTPRDLSNTLSLEKQKQLVGCQSDSCMA